MTAWAPSRRSLLRRTRTRPLRPKDLAALLAASPLPRHVVLVLVQRLDRSVTRSIRYARALHPDVVRGLHVVLDSLEATSVAEEWEGLDLAHLTLELRDAPDRRIDRAVLHAAFEEMDGRTHVSIVVPRRLWRPRWWALLAHDRSASSLVRAVTHLRLRPLTVTVVPFAVGADDRAHDGVTAVHEGAAHRG